MASPKTMTLEHLVASTLRRQLRKLSREAARARSDNGMEPLHQVRVAARRLRSTLAVFGDLCFRERSLRSWRKSLRRLTRRLGRPRDLDVQIAFVRGVLEAGSHASLRPGMERLYLRLRQRRDKHGGRTEKALTRFAADQTAQQMLAAAHALTPCDAPGDASRDLHAACRNSIHGALAELFSYRDCLLNPDDTQRHHAMRIRAKRLRYAMEVCCPAYGCRLKPMIEAARTLQTLLGELHDCDVWLRDLAAFEAAEWRRTEEYYGHSRPFDKLKPGLDSLVADRRQRRQDIFRTLGATWRTFEKRGVWTKLATILDPAAKPHQPPSTP